MEFTFRENKCFVCGLQNEDGLQLRFEKNSEGTSKARCVFAEKYQGYDNIVHGGLIAAVLDDTMAYAIMGLGLMPVTAEMKIRYKKPTRVGEEITLEGKVTKVGRKMVEVEAYAKGPDGEVRVHAEGKFVIGLVKARE